MNTFNMKKIALIGASGFIGSVILKEALERGEYIEVQPYQDWNPNEYRNLRIGFMYCFPTS